MATTRLILLRHGESTCNVLGVATSALEGYPLTDLGRSQAAAVAEELAEVGAGHVFSSAVLRARETAQIVADRGGLAVTVVDGLEEIHVGGHEGHSGEDIVRRGTVNWEQWLGVGNLEHGFAGGETARETGMRVSTALARVVREQGSGTAIVVSHGAAIALALMYLCSNLAGPFLHDHLLDNCGRVDVLIEDGAWRCVRWAGVEVEARKVLG